MNKHVEDKISRIDNNLRASTGFTGKFGAPQHLFKLSVKDQSQI